MRRFLVRHGGFRPHEQVRHRLQLTSCEREEISRGSAGAAADADVVQANLPLLQAVLVRLEWDWSLEQIAAPIWLDIPDEAAMRISYGAIYRS